MALPALFTNIDDLLDYCFRALGAPVINIEIDLDQAYDRISDTITKFNQSHFDGVEHVYLKHTITYQEYLDDVIVTPPATRAIVNIMVPQQYTSAEAMASIQYQFVAQSLSDVSSMQLQEYYMTLGNLSLLNELFSPSYTYQYNKATNSLRPDWKLNPFYSGNLLGVTAHTINHPNWTLTNCSVVTAGTTLPTGRTADIVSITTPGVWSIEQTVDLKYYPIGLYTMLASINTAAYTDTSGIGPITLTISDGNRNIIQTKTVSPSAARLSTEFVDGAVSASNSSNLIITVSGTGSGSFDLAGVTLAQNNFFIIDMYQDVNPDTYVDVYNDEWVKRYSTALIKRQWGTNIKKFDGVQLPGGITMNGQTIYDEAQQEIDKLDDIFVEKYELPVDLMWG